MVTNDLGACEWFVWDIRRSGLIDRGQLDQIVSEFLKRNPRAEAPALADHLVQQQILTSFQSDRILNGKTQGLVLGPYVLQNTIGQGSMGQVYQATSKNDNLLYAVKVLPRRSMWNVRLARRQVRSFGQFNHNAVVPFVDVGTAGGLHYLVWPLAEGSTLENKVQSQGRLSPQETALIGVQTAQGLNICHQNNIFHGLIKPSNLMIGDDGQTRILDFGIGSLLVENEGESLVDTMSTANTLTSGLDCTAPESIMEPTNRTPAGDQYSLGCVLYYCLTGRVPFPEGSAVEKMMAHQTKEPVSVRDFAPEAPEGLVAVISKLMAKTPEARFSGTDEVVEALEPYLGELAGVTADEAPAMSRTAPNRQSGFNIATTPGPVGGSRGPAPAPNFNSARQAPSATPAKPSRGLQPTTPAPQPRIQNPAPIPSRQPAGRMPSRDSFQLPQAVEEVQLLTAIDEQPSPYSDPAALRASAGWLNDAEEETRRATASRGGNIGIISIIAVSVILMALVFVGAKLVMQQ
ncbi:MAG: serine/threonine protein kinase [Fimbriiglobus sp.]